MRPSPYRMGLEVFRSVNSDPSDPRLSYKLSCSLDLGVTPILLPRIAGISSFNLASQVGKRSAHIEDIEHTGGAVQVDVGRDPKVV